MRAAPRRTASSRSTRARPALTMAAPFQDPSVATPVFVRFSTVAGSRGSTDTPRDVRGFAVKFYTTDGVWDLVGNNMPVFFIQDANKFPDLIHAVKPEPHNEIPQAQSAHDTFWDFVSLTPESAHMLMWLMSDRAIPRSLRHDGRLRRPHLPPGQCRGRVALREVPLEAAEGRLLAGVGGSHADFRQGPRFQPPRPVRSDRARRLPGMGARASRSSRRTTSTSSVSTCSMRPSSSPRSSCRSSRSAR